MFNLNLLLLLTLFYMSYVTNGFNGRCATMLTITSEECEAAAMEHFDYTVEDISTMQQLHAVITGLLMNIYIYI